MARLHTHIKELTISKPDNSNHCKTEELPIFFAIFFHFFATFSHFFATFSNQSHINREGWSLREGLEDAQDSGGNNRSLCRVPRQIRP